MHRREQFSNLNVDGDSVRKYISGLPSDIQQIAAAGPPVGDQEAKLCPMRSNTSLWTEERYPFRSHNSSNPRGHDMKADGFADQVTALAVNKGTIPHHKGKSRKKNFCGAISSDPSSSKSTTPEGSNSGEVPNSIPRILKLLQ